MQYFLKVLFYGDIFDRIIFFRDSNNSLLQLYCGYKQ